MKNLFEMTVDEAGSFMVICRGLEGTELLLMVHRHHVVYLFARGYKVADDGIKVLPADLLVQYCKDHDTTPETIVRSYPESKQFFQWLLTNSEIVDIIGGGTEEFEYLRKE